ncbi:MAG: peptidoglycan-associated lipoprotein Pal [Elusimicrobiota bacterium]
MAENSFLKRHWGILAAGLALVFASCAPKQVKMAQQPVAPAPVAVSTAAPVNAAEANIRTGEFVDVDGVNPVFFDYNKADIRADARALIQANARYLKDHPELEARIAGYCDERGTVEYNLALGQRRAKAVRDYYIRLGVDGSRIATISYGKEKPFCQEHNEACWAKNRRAQTSVRQNAAAQAQTSSPAPTPASAALPAPPSAGQ